jgi:hypothetical protein
MQKTNKDYRKKLIEGIRYMKPAVTPKYMGDVKKKKEEHKKYFEDLAKFYNIK